MTGRSSQSAAHSAWPVTVITDARPGASEEQWRRQKRYMITMGFRTACFVSMLFVPGAWRWVLFAGAVLLPYVAVIFANQVDSKGRATPPVEGAEPEDLPRLTVGDERIVPGEQDVDGETDEAAEDPQTADAEAGTGGASSAGRRKPSSPGDRRVV